MSLPSIVNEAKEKGRTAFKDERWEEAIHHFGQVIEADPTDVTCLAIRSSAHQKVGNLDAALADAHRTVVLQPTYVRGYIRKACVLRAMKDYSTEVETYLAGLEHVPGDDSLTKGLQMASRLKINASKASYAAKTTRATREAAFSRLVKASQATDMATFVTQTKMNLELQMVALQAQLDLVSELTTMPTREKIDFLFSLITTYGQMTTMDQVVSAVQQASSALPFGSKIHSALDVALATQDKVDDTTTPTTTTTTSADMMTRESFAEFIDKVVTELHTSIGDFTEFVVYQVLFTGVAAPSKPGGGGGDGSDGGGGGAGAAVTIGEGGGTANDPGILQSTSVDPPAATGAVGGDPADADPSLLNANTGTGLRQLDEDVMTTTTNIPIRSVLNDERMQGLFVLFDKDADSTVDFKEVALGLYPLTKNMGEAAKNAAGLLLMVDRDDQRVLSYEQFAKLMLAVSGAFGMTFDELADLLTWELANAGNTDVDESIMQEIMVAEEAYAKAAEQRKKDDQRQKTLDALSYSRTQKLFELWDANGDGTIDFQELMRGLRRYQKACMGGGGGGGSSNTLSEVERDALMIMGHDDDNNQALDPEEFAYAMANYAEKVGTSLHELIDFMCVVSSESTAAAEYAVKMEETTIQQRMSGTRFQPSMGTILDMNGGDDDEEEEEEGW